MGIDISQFFQTFFDESGEHLAEMEKLLLDMDVDAPDMEEMNAIFRAAHSIKGGSGTFGFTDMTEVTHVLENLLDRLRKGEMAPRAEMIDVFLEATDVLKAQLACHTNGTICDAVAAHVVCEKLHALTEDQKPTTLNDSASAETTSSVAANEVSAVTQAIPSPTTLYELVFRPGKSFLKRKKSAKELIAELSRLGTVEFLDKPESAAKDKTVKGKRNKKSDIKPAHWHFRLTTNATLDTIHEVFSFYAEPEELDILQLPPLPVTVDEDLGFGIFTDPVTPAATTIEKDEGYGFFEPVSPEPVVAPPPLPKSIILDRRAPPPPSATPLTTESSSIRVGIEKVDQLINLVGELVITQAMLAQTAVGVDPVLHEALGSGMAQLERNTRDLQESVMSIRMMPISFVFSRFSRVVRDLAAKFNKQVDLVTVGENTELDKGLIEKISDPLTHLVRNSLDHGIESPETRLAAGKPAKGTIRLSASHQGGNILIEVSDDGAGLNRERILSKARERELDVTDSMTDADVWQLIFAPGFSTAEVITDVSGRGVGMDVVKRNISEMGGVVSIDSYAGKGTKITIRLPLTLAILDGMSVSLGDNLYVIPLNLIVETLQPKPEDLKTVAGEGAVVQVRGEYLPIIALHTLFNMPTQITNPCEGVLVLIEAQGRKAALFVDSLVGQQQVVIKSLETNFRKILGVSGATIMGDGTVALIIDVPTVIRLGQQKTIIPTGTKEKTI